MSKVNKILIIFMLFTCSAIYGSWLFIHSKSFSTQASNKISTLLEKKIGLKLKFEKVSFGMFPPSTSFKNVTLSNGPSSKYVIKIKLEDFGVNFTYWSFLSAALEVDDLEFKSGNVEFKYYEDPNDPDIDWKKIKISKVFSDYQKIYDKLPVKFNTIRMNNIHFSTNDADADINSLEIILKKRTIKLKNQISKINITKQVPKFDLPKNARLDTEAELDYKKLKISKFDVSDEFSSLGLRGEVEEKKNELINGLKLSIKGKLEDHKQYFKTTLKELDNIKGDYKLEVNSKGELFNPTAESTLQLENFKSNYVELEKVKLIFSKNKNLISIDSLFGTNQKEEYKVSKSFQFFDLNKMEFVKTKGEVSLRNAFTNTFLFTIRDSLSVLKGYLTGKIEVTFDGSKVNFKILDKAQLKDFKLVLPKSKKPLLENNGFNLTDSLISLDSKGNVGLDLVLEMANTLLKINGTINEKGINLKTTDSKINLTSLGPISGVKLEGGGPVDLDVYGPFDDIRFDFDVNWKKFSVVKLNFGDVKSKFSLSLEDIILSVDKLEGKFNNTNYTANGWLKFGDESGLDVKLDFPDTSFQDARQMYALVFENLKLPKDLAFKFDTHLRVFGSFDLPSLKIEGKIKGKEFRVFNEEFDTLTLGLNLNERQLKFSQVKLKKGRGEINGSASISLLNNYSEVEAYGNGIRLSDFNNYKKLNLSYDSDISLEYDGNGTDTTYSSRLKFKTIEPFIGTVPASASSGLVYLNSSELVAKLNLLSGKVKLDSAFNFINNNSSIKGTVETNDLKELFGVISGHNILDKRIQGNIKASLNTSFNMETFNISKFSLDVKQFRLKRDNIDLKIDNTNNSILVEDGKVKKWDLLFSDGNNYFKSKGINSSDQKSIILNQDFNIKSEIFELANGSVEKSRGVLEGKNQIQVGNGININSFNLHSINNSLKIKNVPGFISNLTYNVVKNGNRFDILGFTSKYGEGDFLLNGYFIFDDMFPTVNIDYKIERSIIPLFKKSNVVVSSSGTLTGTELPYNLQGRLQFLQGDLIDDPSDLGLENKVSIDEYNKYLPFKNDASNTGYVKLNVSFDCLREISIKNNLAEILLRANGQLNGNLLSPEIVSNIVVVPNVSKFKFKGHDFILNQGSVELHDKGKTRTSTLKFLGNAKVNEYDIKLDITGSIDKPEINLVSEQLKQEDILSLLTIGVTSDINKNLDPTERSSIQRIQFTSLLLNQTKLNEDINNTIGVNLSVLPEFESDETNLVESGKASVSSSSSNKIKSTTKIKINKKITNKLEVGVSSTVGGSIEQTQQMNANYNINKNLSVEGVYEVKPSEDESTSTPTSYGLDLKWKWSF